MTNVPKAPACFSPQDVKVYFKSFICLTLTQEARNTPVIGPASAHVSLVPETGVKTRYR